MTLRQVPTWASQMQKEDKSNEIRSCADLNTVEDNLKDRIEKGQDKDRIGRTRLE